MPLYRPARTVVRQGRDATHGMTWRRSGMTRDPIHRNDICRPGKEGDTSRREHKH